MAITTQFNTGFEHGLASASGSGLFSAITGAGVSVTTGAKRNGTYGLHIASPVNTITQAQFIPTTAVNKFLVRFAVKVSSRPASTQSTIAYFVWGGNFVKVLVDSTGQLGFQLNSGTITSTGVTIDTANFHLLELQLDGSGTTWTIDWKLDSVAQTRWSSVLGGTGTVTQFLLGCDAATEPAFTADYDDLIFGSWTATTDWYGDGKGLGYIPTSDGTHASPTLFSPGDAGTAFTAGVTTAFTHLNAAPWTTVRSTTVNLAQRTTGTVPYLELNVGGAAETGSANAVRALLSYSSSTTTANNASTIAFNSAGGSSNTGNVVLFGDFPTANGGQGGAAADYSESTNFFKGGQVPAPVAGWTAAEVNSVKFRFGRSSDISPVPTAQGLMVEVDWPIVTVAANPTKPVVAPSVATVVASVR